MTSLTADFIVKVITCCLFCQELFLLSLNPSTSLCTLSPDNSGPGAHPQPLYHLSLDELSLSELHTFFLVIVHVHFSVKAGDLILIAEPVHSLEHSGY